MAVIDYDNKEVNAKIVYYGPGLSGKTSNIHYIHSKLMPEHRGELMTLATKSHRTLFFDFLPVELGEIKGLNTRFFLYTVPGQIFYNNIRKQILKDADGIVFVADSLSRLQNDNIQSFQNLEENLAEEGRSLKDISHVIQYNKRDMPDILTLEELHQQINKYNAPFFEVVAINGQGVLKTLTTISKMVLKTLREGANLSAKVKGDGPDKAYGLTNEFIAMSLEEAEKVKEEAGPEPPPPDGPEPPLKAAPKPEAPATLPNQDQAPIPAAVPTPPAAAPPPPAPVPPKPVIPQVQLPGQLKVAKWGNPQLTPSGVLKLPVIFKDPDSGKEYVTSISIQMGDMKPKK
jgi:mutual gliding-motility protein MglA